MIPVSRKSGPSELPDAIQYINLENNELTILPDVLPRSIKYMDLSSNNLQTLPACITWLARNTVIHIEKKRPTNKQYRDYNMFYTTQVLYIYLTFSRVNK